MQRLPPNRSVLLTGFVFSEQFGHFRHIRRNPSCFVASEQTGRGPADRALASMR
jgi:hypothetical protein